MTGRGGNVTWSGNKSGQQRDRWRARTSVLKSSCRHAGQAHGRFGFRCRHSARRASAYCSPVGTPTHPAAEFALRRAFMHAQRAIDDILGPYHSPVPERRARCQRTRSCTVQQSRAPLALHLLAHVCLAAAAAARPTPPAAAGRMPPAAAGLCRRQIRASVRDDPLGDPRLVLHHRMAIHTVYRQVSFNSCASTQSTIAVC